MTSVNNTLLIDFFFIVSTSYVNVLLIQNLQTLLYYGNRSKYNSWFKILGISIPSLKYSVTKGRYTHITKNVMAPIKQLIKLISWETETVETVLPQSHAFEWGKHLWIWLQPIGASERQKQEQASQVCNAGPYQCGIWNR